MKPALIREIYKFEKEFDIWIDVPAPIETNEEEEPVEDNDDGGNMKLKVELLINHEEKTFTIDFTNPLDVDKGIIKLHGPNHFGNHKSAAMASCEFYSWVADICEFASQCLNKKSVKKKK